MLDILQFTKDENDKIYGSLLADDNWQHADFYDLDAGSIFWNRASLVSIQKKYTADASAALIYLLQKEAHELSLWDAQWGNTIPDLSSFIQALLSWGRFRNTSGDFFSTESFWDKFSDTIDGFRDDAGFEFTKNGLPISFSNPLNKEDLLKVICFEDSWNENHFLIETKKEWVLFYWSSAA